MALSEIDSFVFKFKNLLYLEKDATMTFKSEAGKVSVCLSVELGHALSSPRRTPRNGPSRQRRRERRAAARVSAKETPAQNTAASNVDSMAGKLEDPSVEEPQVEHNATAEEVVENLCDKPIIQVDDEVCPDAEYEDEKGIAVAETSVCSVQLFPKRYTLDKLEGFRSSIEDYFKKRTDVIEQVIKCEVENYGNNVKLVTKMKMKRGWIFFFFDQEENYPDLEGVRTIRHCCSDLSNCD